MGERSTFEGRLDAPGHRLGVLIGAAVRAVIAFFSSLSARFEKRTEIAWEDGEVEETNTRK